MYPSEAGVISAVRVKGIQAYVWELGELISI